MGNTTKTDYEKYGFVKVGKTAKCKAQAFCKNCPLALTNTCVDRLEKHQQICPKSGGSLLHRPSTSQASKNLDNEESDECDDEPPAKRSVPSTPTTGNNVLNVPSTPTTGNNRPSGSTSTPTTSKMIYTTSGKQTYLITDRMGKKEGQAFQENLADCFFANRLPFRLVEDVYFRNLFIKNRPACEKYLPTRQYLGTKLLDDALARYSLGDISEKEEDTCLLVDGWKNKVSGDKWFCLVLHRATGHTSYLKSELTNDLKEEGEVLGRIVHETSIKAKCELRKCIYCVISDNAANMICMGNEVSHCMWHVRCNSHTGNLLSHDCIGENLGLFEAIKDIQSKFKANFQRLVKRLSKKAVVLSCQTRWGSVLKMYENFIHNLETYQQIALSHDKKKCLSAEMKNAILVDGESLRCRVLHEIAIQSPIVDLITVSQGKECNLSKIAECWLKLENNLPEICSRSVKKHVRDRKEMALCDVTLAAYFFDINKDRSLLTQWQKVRIEKFVNKHLKSDRDSLSAFGEYKSMGKYFYTISDEEDAEVDARIFWGSMSYQYPALSKLALRLLNIPASSSEIERVFSKWREVHTTLRNRLGAEKSEKLLRAYYYLHCNRPEKKGKKQGSHYEDDIEDDILDAVSFTDYVRTVLEDEDETRFVEELLSEEDQPIVLDS